MGRLVVIEGIDGSGKRTLTRSLTGALSRRRLTVGELAFPRYGEDVHADLAQDALHGRLGGLADSIHGMALLFALDRFGARERLERDLHRYDVVLVDRYIASNAAYQAARLYQDSQGDMVRWVRDLEVGRLGLPVPDVQFLVRVPVDVAAERAARREDTELRVRDRFETDDGLQTRCAAVYDDLAVQGWLSPWHVIDGRAEIDAEDIAETALGQAVSEDG